MIIIIITTATTNTTIYVMQPISSKKYTEHVSKQVFLIPVVL